MTNKLLPVALIAALIGGSVAALVMHKSQPSTAETVAADNAKYSTVSGQQQLDNQAVPTEFNTAPEQTAYKTGFADGFNAAAQTASNGVVTGRTVVAPGRGVYRNASTRTAPRRVYYDYNRPSNRTFWQKHRDKLSVGIGTGAGALIGGLIGGKKGAAIGALSGAGGSALYTYKLRKRTPRY
jgi:phosphate/sulfate permease